MNMRQFCDTLTDMFPHFCAGSPTAMVVGKFRVRLADYPTWNDSVLVLLHDSVTNRRDWLVCDPRTRRTPLPDIGSPWRE